MCPILCDPTDYSSPGSFLHEILQARILRVGCHFLLQGSISTQGLNLGLPHCRQTRYHLSDQEIFVIKPNNNTIEYILWESHNSKRHIYPNSHCSTTCNVQDMETCLMSINKLMDKEAVVHICSGILLSHRNE